MSLQPATQPLPFAPILPCSYEWMAAAQAAGTGARMRAGEAQGLLNGDVMVDNVSTYQLYDLR